MNLSMPTCLWCGSPTQSKLICFDRRFGIPGKREYRFCNHCYSYSINPIPSLVELKAWYEKFYVFEGSKVGISKEFWQTLKQNLDGQENLPKLLQPGPVLDVGCGSGNLLIAAQHLGHEVWGQEFNPQMVNLVRNLGIKVTDLPLTDSYFPQRYFTNIVLSQLIEHVENPVGLLQDLLPLLEANGQIIISTPNPHCILAKLYREGWAGWHTPFHLSLPSKQALIRVATQLELTCKSLTTNTPTWLFMMNFLSYFAGKEGEFNHRLIAGISKSQHLLLMPFLPVLRIIDLLKLGDNTVVILQKQSR